ncbi:hypothetical protein PRK78_003514 [Emydomyces testavorans]|uniref:non-specific serine/threonine protein kinase n=1 Tax=Emydomyces testavorans TaxID=2070801 RepID=A0AAF0IIL5_9EURO|nr:hypothetical protein PRK78_003514 [Emydomyces testavorans]
MVVRKRKTSSSKTFFERAMPQKPVEAPVGSSQHLSNTVTSTSESSSKNSQSRDSVRSFLRKSGSKLLSMLRIRSNGIGAGTKHLSANLVQGDKISASFQLETSTQNEVECSASTPKGLLAPSRPAHDEAGDTDTLPAVLLGPSSSLRLQKNAVYNSNTDGIAANQRHSDRCPRAVDGENISGRISSSRVPRRHSSPGLTHIISHKFSTTFGHPTVIHRVNLRHRPSIRNFSFTPPTSSIGLQRLGDNAQDTSDSSSSAGSRSGSSPRTQSTNPTSQGASLTPPPKILSKESQNNGASSETSAALENKPHQLEKVVPSIVTVETAASAKIFFETYFNELLSGESPRSQRQRELEERLYLSHLCSEERLRAKLAWYRQESDHLRQDRVLKSRSNCTNIRESVSVAGYEVIKVLGKGSFGVVRLVRERQAFGNSYEASTLGSHGDRTHKRSSTMDALWSVVDGTRSFRRKDPSKMRKDVYAMKVIRKSDMIRNCQEGHLRAERDFLVASAKSQWIAPLIASFQDAHNLYLVMDYMVGGDFLSLLVRKNILTEDVARWYVAEMILCVEEAHRLRWIHRDVKPDNFLISASGHLKLSDFGLAFDGHWSHDQTYFMSQRQSLMSKLGIQVEGDAKDRKAAEEAAKRTTAELSNLEPGKNHGQLPSIPGPGPNDDILHWRNRKGRKRLARSVVGTSQYMAPEVIRGEPYDGRCDWWSIGIILYEVWMGTAHPLRRNCACAKHIKCLYGFTPFASKTRSDTKEKILHHPHTLYFPTERSSDKLVSAEAVDLIFHILQEKEYRLCSRKYMLNDFVHSGRIPGELLDYPADRTLKSYRGYYVYSDDATDIKNHPFFQSTRWDELHYRTPPFVPKVKSWEDTKYFDCGQVSDARDGSSEASPPDEADISPEAPLNKSGKAQMDGLNTGNKSGGRSKNGVLGFVSKFQNKSHKRKREKKRARDKVLRDAQVGKIALDIRKRNAFLGYTYRRPKDVLLALEPERGRSLTQAPR